MSEITTLFDDNWAGLEFDTELYPKDAIYGAAYVFIDRCHLHLDRAGEARVRVRIKAKTGKAEETRTCAGEFQNELLAQAYRQRIAVENRALIESITSRAIAGAAGPPGLDDLLAMDIGDETAFDDPLGIAMSWEEKYKKKGDKAAPANAAAPAALPAVETAAVEPVASPAASPEEKKAD